MSRPIVVIVCMDAPPNRGSLNSAHIFGTHVPVEEPSTASLPHSCTAALSSSIRSPHRRHVLAGCGFRRSRPGIPIEGGHHSNRRRAVLARRHVHGVTALVRRQDRIVWLRSFACCLLST